MKGIEYMNANPTITVRYLGLTRTKAARMSCYTHQVELHRVYPSTYSSDSYYDAAIKIAGEMSVILKQEVVIDRKYSTSYADEYVFSYAVK